MNRNPKHAPPGELLKKVMSSLMVRVVRRTAKDCAYCRNSELRGMHFACKLDLVVESCESFKDSRDPSSLVPFTAEYR